MKKKIIIAIIVIVIAVIGVLGYMVISDLGQEEKLNQEFSEIADLSNAENINIDELNKRLDRTVTTGDYAKVEVALKSYLKDTLKISEGIMNVLNDERITNLLTLDNYKNDGTEFTESKKFIEDTRGQLEDDKNKLSELLTKEKAMSYIENEKLDSYYVDIYEKEFAEEIATIDDESLEKSLDEIIEILNISEKVLNLLSENPNSWTLTDENIVFSNESLANQYDALINSIG